MDIIGFDEQIGAAKKPSIVKKMVIRPKQVVRNVVQKIVPVKPVNKVVSVKKVVPVKSNPMIVKSQTARPRIVVQKKPIFSTDKKPVVKKVISVQKILPSIKKLSPSNQIKFERSIPVTASNMSKLSPIQRSFTKADLPYQAVVKKNPIVRLKNTPISYSTSVDMIQPPVDSGVVNYYGK